MTDAFDRIALVGAEELELRPEARVLVFADGMIRDAAVEVFRDCVCVSVAGVLDLVDWIPLNGRRLIVRGDEDFCDRVVDFVGGEVDGVLGLEPFNGADAESILARAVPPAPFDDRLVRRTRSDSGAPFEPVILDRLVDMGIDAYERIRGRLRDEADFRRLGALDEAVKRIRDARDPPEQGESQVDRLLAISKSYECFRNEFEKPFVSLEAKRPDGGTHIDTLGVRSRKLRLSLMYRYYGDHGRAPGDAALRVVIDTLEAKALCGGIVRPVAIRHCWRDGKIYIDLGTEDRSVIEIDSIDWRVLERSPADVRFLRPAGTLPLPIPVRVSPKEGLAKLKEVTRFQTERDEIVSVGFILHSIAGRKPYAVLLITGEPGAAKTAHVIVIGGLVDPRAGLKGTALNTKRDIYIAASTRGLVVLNNMSDLSRENADAICTGSEGGVDARRALYTDEDESSIYAAAPFIVTSVFNVAAPYGDLSNRTLRVDLAAMPRAERLSESDFQAKFDAVAPVILGGMLSALSEGLRRLPGLGVKDLPRLAEFATFATACETAFWDEGAFLKAFNEAAETNADEVLLGDPVARILLQFMTDRPVLDGTRKWVGTATDLLKELETVIRASERIADLALAMAKSAVGVSKEAGDIRKVTEAAADLKEAREHVHTVLDAKWPKAAHALSARLKSVGPQLKDAGIWIKWPARHGDAKVLEITYLYVSPTHIKGRGEGASQASQRLGTIDDAIVFNELDDISAWDAPRSVGRSPSQGDALQRPVRPRSGPDAGFAGSSSEIEPTPSDAPSIAPDLGEYTPGLHNKRKSLDI